MRRYTMFVLLHDVKEGKSLNVNATIVTIQKKKLQEVERAQKECRTRDLNVFVYIGVPLMK